MKYTILLLLLLSACNHSKNQPAIQLPAPIAYFPITIYIEGDSTMFGSHPGDPGNWTVYNPPALLQAAYTRNVTLFAVTVENHAEPGSDSFDSLDGTDYYNGPFSKRMAESTAQIVITNDALNNPGRGRASLDQYRSNLNEWITIARQYGKIPILEEPNPWLCMPDDTLLTYVQVQRDVAVKQGVLLIKQYDAILEAFPDLQSALQDCEHPSDALYDFKANREFQQLQPLINQLEGIQ